jgi:hypothetical protein
MKFLEETKMKKWMLLTVFLGGCGMSSSNYLESYAEIYCDRITNECADDDFVMFESASDCELFLNGFGSLAVADCDYDAKAAKDCIKEIEEATCDDINAGDGTASCDIVYTGGSCDDDGDDSDTDS